MQVKILNSIAADSISSNTLHTERSESSKTTNFLFDVRSEASRVNDEYRTRGSYNLSILKKLKLIADTLNNIKNTLKSSNAKLTKEDYGILKSIKTEVEDIHTTITNATKKSFLQKLWNIINNIINYCKSDDLDLVIIKLDEAMNIALGVFICEFKDEPLTDITMKSLLALINSDIFGLKVNAFLSKLLEGKPLLVSQCLSKEYFFYLFQIIIDRLMQDPKLDMATILKFYNNLILPYLNLNMDVNDFSQILEILESIISKFANNACLDNPNIQIFVIDLNSLYGFITKITNYQKQTHNKKLSIDCNCYVDIAFFFNGFNNRLISGLDENAFIGEIERLFNNLEDNIIDFCIRDNNKIAIMYDILYNKMTVYVNNMKAKEFVNKIMQRLINNIINNFNHDLKDVSDKASLLQVLRKYEDIINIIKNYISDDNLNDLHEILNKIIYNHENNLDDIAKNQIIEQCKMLIELNNMRTKCNLFNENPQSSSFDECWLDLIELLMATVSSV